MIKAAEIRLSNTFMNILKICLGTSRSSVDRLLDPKNSSVTLLTLENVAVALGKRLKLQFA
jgi:antitoxin HicB